jgi:RNAse (barnase) inhibitor barstar
MRGATALSFAEDTCRAEDGDFIARIPSGIGNRETLFHVLADHLKFPEYFGHNWDALWDCLRDLTWIPAHRVFLVHADLPALPEEALTTYLQILNDAVKDWQRGDQHQLIVVFPATARERVENLLSPCRDE